MTSVLELILGNQALVGSSVVFFLTILKLTKWGRAQAEALDMVINVIEDQDPRTIKRQVATATKQSSQGAADAIDHAVRKADRHKQPRKFIERAAMEVLRGWGRKL